MAAERILTEAASVSFTACRTAAIRFSAHPTRVSVASRSACGSEKFKGRHSYLLINLWTTHMKKEDPPPFVKFTASLHFRAQVALYLDISEGVFQYNSQNTLYRQA